MFGMTYYCSYCFYFNYCEYSSYIKFRGGESQRGLRSYNVQRNKEKLDKGQDGPKTSF